MRTVAGSRLGLERLRRGDLGRSADAKPAPPETNPFLKLSRAEALRIHEIGYFNRRTVGLDTDARCVIEHPTSQ
jgi:hypothetical protein